MSSQEKQWHTGNKYSENMPRKFSKRRQKNAMSTKGGRNRCRKEKQTGQSHSQLPKGWTPTPARVQIPEGLQ